MLETYARGTTEEFRVYWAALATAQQDEYKADAERLQSAGMWTKGSDCVVCGVGSPATSSNAAVPLRLSCVPLLHV